MRDITINITNNPSGKALLNFLSKFDYIEIEQEKELTAKEEHELLKQSMLINSNKFITNQLLKNEYWTKTNSWYKLYIS